MLLGKLDRAGPGLGWLGYISPFVALALVALCAVVWRLALRRYASAGG